MKYLVLDGLLTPYQAGDAPDKEVFEVKEGDLEAQKKIKAAVHSGQILDTSLEPVGYFGDVEDRMRKAAKASPYCQRKGILQKAKGAVPEAATKEAEALAVVAKKDASVPQAIVRLDKDVEELKKPPVKEDESAALYRAVKNLVEADIRMAGESRPNLTNAVKKIVESGKFDFDSRIDAAEATIKALGR